MNNPLAANPVYTETFPNKKGWPLFNIICLNFIALINIAKVIKGKEPFDFFGILWFFFAPIFILQIIDTFYSSTTFIITDAKLQVVKRNLFRRRVVSYDIDAIQQIEVQHQEVKTIFNKLKTTSSKLLTFTYNNKGVVLGSNLNDFKADDLAGRLVGAQ